MARGKQSAQQLCSEVPASGVTISWRLIKGFGASDFEISEPSDYAVAINGCLVVRTSRHLLAGFSESRSEHQKSLLIFHSDD